jgi:hypothetical protein
LGNISEFGKNILMLSVFLNSKDVKDTKMYRVNLEFRSSIKLKEETAAAVSLF